MGASSFIPSRALIGVGFIFAFLIALCNLPQSALAKDGGITRHYTFDVCINEVVSYGSCIFNSSVLYTLNSFDEVSY